jgi:hypothetical protein
MKEEIEQLLLDIQKRILEDNSLDDNIYLFP